MTHQLQELADALCRGFCRWNLQHDKHVLTRLGPGKLQVDLLKKTCRFERNYIPALVIVDALTRQFRRQLQENGVAPDTIRSATLSIVLTIEERDNQKDKSVMWFGKHNGFVGWQMEIQSTVGTDEESCRGEFRGYLEWPREPEL